MSNARLMRSRRWLVGACGLPRVGACQRAACFAARHGGGEGRRRSHERTPLSRRRRKHPSTQPAIDAEARQAKHGILSDARKPSRRQGRRFGRAFAFSRRSTTFATTVAARWKAYRHSTHNRHGKHCKHNSNAGPGRHGGADLDRRVRDWMPERRRKGVEAVSDLMLDRESAVEPVVHYVHAG